MKTYYGQDNFMSADCTQSPAALSSFNSTQNATNSNNQLRLLASRIQADFTHNEVTSHDVGIDSKLYFVSSDDLQALLLQGDFQSQSTAPSDTNKVISIAQLAANIINNACLALASTIPAGYHTYACLEVFDTSQLSDNNNQSLTNIIHITDPSQTNPSAPKKPLYGIDLLTNGLSMGFSVSEDGKTKRHNVALGNIIKVSPGQGNYKIAIIFPQNTGQKTATRLSLTAFPERLPNNLISQPKATCAP